jgi:hypothetical protein
MPQSFRVRTAFAPSGDDPLRLQKGEAVAILPRTSEWPGWLWCRDEAGRFGWIPETYLAPTEDGARLRFDYESTELPAEAGEIFRAVSEYGGWVWGLDARGRIGWIPRDRLEPVD